MGKGRSLPPPENVWRSASDELPPRTRRRLAVQWQWEYWYPGYWTDYEPKTNKKIETEWQKDIHAHASIGGWIVMFTPMLQKSVDRDSVRRVRRTLVTHW